MNHDQFGGLIGQIGEEARVNKTTDCEAVLIGYGPYGLPSAAHLKTIGIFVLGRQKNRLQRH